MNYSGWVSSDNYEEEKKRVKKAAANINRPHDIESIEKKPGTCCVYFKGKLKQPVDAFDLLAWVDQGNLCFGGIIEINDTEFKGIYYTN